MLFTFEVTLSVSDYASNVACAEANDDALAMAKEEFATLAGIDVDKIPANVIWKLEFQEWDSNNPTHASCYWLVTVNDEGIDDA